MDKEYNERKLLSKEFFKFKNPLEVLSSLRFWQGVVVCATIIFLFWFLSNTNNPFGKTNCQMEANQKLFDMYNWTTNMCKSDNLSGIVELGMQTDDYYGWYGYHTGCVEYAIENYLKRKIRNEKMRDL